MRGGVCGTSLDDTDESDASMDGGGSTLRGGDSGGFGESPSWFRRRRRARMACSSDILLIDRILVVLFMTEIISIVCGRATLRCCGSNKATQAGK
jgi:hypothetical protein